MNYGKKVFWIGWVLVWGAGCGEVRFRSEALSAPVFLREMRGGSGTAPVRLMMFEGKPPVSAGSPVGTLSFVERQVRFEVTPSGQANRIENDITTGSYPVIQDAEGADGVFLSVYVDEAARLMMENPKREDPPTWYSPSFGYCSKFRFLGNDRLSRPFICTPDAIFCVIPRPTEVPCELDPAAQTVCAGYYPVPFNPDAMLKKTIANHRFMLSEPRAFECIETRVGHPLTFEFRNYRELRTLRMVPAQGGERVDFNWGS
jgi:hypothetical protein